MSPAQPLPEVAEAEATGRVAEIYAAFRSATGLPMVNLVWRHMATFDGALVWAWGALGETFRSGAIAAGAARAVGDVRAAAPPLDESPGGEAVAATRAVLSVYNHANPINLIALQALAHLLADRPFEGRTFRGAAPASPDARLPALVGVVDAATEARMAELAGLINGGESALTPTVLRHLAHWPDALEALRAPVAAMVADGTVAAEAAALLERSAAEAARLPVGGTGAGRPAAEVVRSVGAAIDTFLPTIARMVVIGRGLAAALDAPAEAG